MSELMQIKRLIDDQGEAWEQFKQTNDQILKAKADGKMVSDLQLKLDSIEAELNKIAEAKEAMEKLIAKANRPEAGDKNEGFEAEFKAFAKTAQLRNKRPVTAQEYHDYKQAFDSYLRKNGNEQMLTDAERKAMSAGSDVDGGYLLPEATVLSVVSKMREDSVLRKLATVVPVGTNDFGGLVDRGDATSGWVAEQAARTATTTPTLAKDRNECAEMYAYPELTQQLIDDAAIDVEAWLIDKVAISFAERENAAFYTGNGVTQPRGLCSYTTAQTADASRTWGEIESIKSGASADFAASNPADYLIDVVESLKTGYRNNAAWITNRGVLGKIRKFKEATTNAYMWQPGMTLGAPNLLFGHPVYLDENMPALAASSLSLAFGDFKRAFLIADRIGTRMLRDPYTNKPKVGLYVTKRVGSAVRDFDAVKFMKFIN